MDHVTALIEQASESLRVAQARLTAARRADWTGLAAEGYRAGLAECAARVATLEREADSLAHLARATPARVAGGEGWPPW
ncbi:MAG: hypothetical protein ACLGHM_04470 [Actinomycetes bacterium]